MNPLHQKRAQAAKPPVPIAPAPKQRRRVRHGFRWEYLFIPLLLLGVMWILSGVDGAAFTFDDVMDHLHVRNREQYRQLCTMGLVAVAIVWCVKVLRLNEYRG